MKTHPDEIYMRRAIRAAAKNLKAMDGGPFGACIVKHGRVVAAARNTVLLRDATCHAEVNAIRRASRRLGTYDLSGCVIYSTTEPCPMCFAAIHWARIGTIVYGTTVQDARRIGFNELRITNRAMKRIGKSRVRIVPHFMKRECAALLAAWNELPDKVVY